MSFFGWVILLDVMAVVTIATLIVRLSISRPADENRAEMAGIVHEVLHSVLGLGGGFRPRRTRTTLSASGEPSTLGLAGAMRASLQGLVRSSLGLVRFSRIAVSRLARDGSAET